MGEKMRAAKEYREENAEKWRSYNGPLTPEIIAEMKADNEKLAELGREATLEWLEENMEKEKGEAKNG